MSKRTEVQPNTSDPLSVLIMTRDAILVEIKHLRDRNARNLSQIEIKNVEITELTKAMIIESRKGL